MFCYRLVRSTVNDASQFAALYYIRFCFPDTATADAFRNRFGGECLTLAPGKSKAVDLG